MNTRLEGYRCSECQRPVGLMADMNGKAERFKCAHTGRWAQLQTPIHRDTKPSPAAQDELVRQAVSKTKAADGRN